MQILKDLQKDIKTLEKAVYSEGSKNRDVNIKLSDTEEKYQKMRKKFDDLMIKMHGGGRK